jgi:hypothetical protein
MAKDVDPAEEGVQDTDCASLDIDKTPSFFLYDADPLGGVMVNQLEAPPSFVACRNILSTVLS